jgi:ABC-type phosphate transport system substrate-binding protein
MGKFKFTRARVLALAVGLGAAASGSLATAPASFAAGATATPPAIGSNCQVDGKINGAGSTFQTNAVDAGLIFGYEEDVCGPAPLSSNLNAAYGGTDPSIGSFGSPAVAVSGMVAYNNSLGGAAETNGSGAGLNRMSCRSDFFAGTDLPYNNSQLTDLDTTPGQLLTDGASTCGAKVNLSAVPPPYGPQTTVGYPNTGDASAQIMGMPIGAGAVAIAENLNGMCTSGTPGSLNLTADELDKIFQGVINQWDDNELVATNPILATDGCHGAIKRVVRFDNSGTTSITMNDLYGVDPNALCSTANGTWYAIGTSSSNNGQWPTGAGCAEGNPSYTWSNGGATTVNQSVSNPNAAAPAAITSGASGSPTLIATVDATNGGIGYAETGLWPSPLPSGVSFANLQTFSDEQTSGNGLANATPAADTTGAPAFTNAGAAGAQSKCALPAGPTTGSTALDAVGLGSPTWTNSATGTAPGKQDIAWSQEGAGYPLCGLTFDLVYKGSHNETGELAGAAGGAATPGCTVSLAATTANGGNAAGSLTVASAAQYPSSGTLLVGGTVVAYTSVSGNTFTGSAIPAGIASGTSVSLNSTPLAATSTAVGVNGGCQSVQGPLQGSTNDQLRTLYSYFTYAFSPLAQNVLEADNYLTKQTLDPLPLGWLSALTTGFQQNF